MKKNKFTRDIPLPSSDSMFGGPGDPQKKYTASDSAQFMQTYGRFEKNAKKIKQYQKDNPQKAMGGDSGFAVGRMNKPAELAQTVLNQADSLSNNPYFGTFMSKQNKKKK
jgi:hypothetical protein